GAAGGLQRRLEHEVLRRIAADEQLRKGDEVGAVPLRLGARGARLGGVAVDVADGRVELRDRDRKGVSGTGVHGLRCSVAGKRLECRPATHLACDFARWCGPVPGASIVGTLGNLQMIALTRAFFCICVGATLLMAAPLRAELATWRQACSDR